MPNLPLPAPETEAVTLDQAIKYLEERFGPRAIDTIIGIVLPTAFAVVMGALVLLRR